MVDPTSPAQREHSVASLSERSSSGSSQSFVSPDKDSDAKKRGVEVASAITVIIMQARALQNSQYSVTTPADLEMAVAQIERAARSIWLALGDRIILPSRDGDTVARDED